MKTLILLVLFVISAAFAQKTQWYTNRVDHFDYQNQATWKQRFWVNETYFQAGGPIFVQIGGEGALNAGAVDYWMMTDYARTYGALCLALEHRFYGESQPFAQQTTENLRYLSSEQALADLADFITDMKKVYKTDGPVITFGGSYPGNLAAWFRLKYPTVTDGSVASSAPVQAELDFFQYLGVVDRSLTNFTGPACDAQIKQAVSQIQTMLTTSEGRNQVRTLFSVCPGSGDLTKPKDVANFMSTIVGNIMGTVQYNDEGNNPITVDSVCKVMEASGSDALTKFVKVQNIYMKAQDQTCIDISYEDMIAAYKNTTPITQGVGPRTWLYQTCTEFGYFQTTDGKNQPFGSLIPLSFYTGMCKDVFGFSFLPLIHETNVRYGGNSIKSWAQASNIVFVNGSIDPWHALSVYAASPNPKNNVTAIFISGTAHCANMSPYRAGRDPLALKQAQDQIRQTIGVFIASAQVASAQ